MYDLVSKKQNFIDRNLPQRNSYLGVKGGSIQDPRDAGKRH